jgi:hypothetical protein
MEKHPSDNSVVITSGGTLCVFDERGRLIGTITQPVERQPLGVGHETVYLARAADEKHAA